MLLDFVYDWSGNSMVRYATAGIYTAYISDLEIRVVRLSSQLPVIADNKVRQCKVLCSLSTIVSLFAFTFAKREFVL